MAPASIEPSWRRDPLAGRWVLVAPARGARPGGALAPRGELDDPPERCPFCPGRESETTPEVWADRPEGRPDGPGWRIRAFPNLYPAFGGRGSAGSTLRSGDPACGHAEVMVHSPDHDVQLGRHGATQVRRVVRAWRLRHMALRADGWAFVHTSVNHGPGSGATRGHPHTQIVALPFVPEAIDREAESMDDACLLCRLAQAVDDELIVAETPQLTAISPVWSRAPYEVLIVPRRHEVRLEEADDLLLDQTADILRDVLSRLDRALGDPPFTLALHSAPPSDTGRFHWHVHIWPRLSIPGGIEWGLGIDVLPIDPVDAAAALRDPPGCA